MITGVLDWLSCLSHVDHEESDSALNALLDVGRNIYPPVDLVSEPLGIQLSTEEIA